MKPSFALAAAALALGLAHTARARPWVAVVPLKAMLTRSPRALVS